MHGGASKRASACESITSEKQQQYPATHRTICTGTKVCFPLLVVGCSWLLVVGMNYDHIVGIDQIFWPCKYPRQSYLLQSVLNLCDPRVLFNKLVSGKPLKRKRRLKIPT